MKTFIISICMFFVLFLGVFYIQHTMESEIERQEAMVFELYETIKKGEWQKADAIANAFEKEVMNKSFFYGMFVEHVDYDNLLTNTAQGVEFVYNRAKSDSTSQCKIILTLLEHMKDKSKVSLENLL